MLEQMIIALALLLALLNAELTESSSSCFHKAEIKRVDENATASVSCPALAEHEKTSISLYKGDTELHSTNLNGVNNNQSSQQFQVHVQNSSVSYKILRTSANDTGLYNCKIGTSASQTILLIKDALQPVESTVTCPIGQILPFAVGCGVVIVYDLLITAFVYYLRYKLKNAEPPENPYINTRPRVFHQR